MLLSRVVFLVVLGAVNVAAVFAHEDATGIVGERMSAMKEIAVEMKALAGMLKAPETLDHRRVVKVAETVALHAEAIPGLFPEGSIQLPSEASDAIWTDWDRFVSLSVDLQTAALELGAAAETGAEPTELKPDFNAIAETCKACHTDFRVSG